MVLCDANWADPDENSNNGIDVKAQLDFLRLDSMIMMVQINIRQILLVGPLKDPDLYAKVYMVYTSIR